MLQYNIYKTTNLVNGKFYWGVHNSIDENDGYFGGGTVFRKAIKKYGKENFRRKTMVTYESAPDAYFDEGLLVTQKYIDENPMCYNVHPGGKGGNGHKKSAETRAKIRASLMGHCRSLESRQKQSITSSDGRMKGKNSPNFGKAPWNKGIKTGPFSEERSRRQSIMMRGKCNKTEEQKQKLCGQNNPNSKTNRAKRELQNGVAL